MINQEKIQKQCFIDDPKERIKALELLKSNFSLMPDKEQAWNNLIKLSNDKDWWVRTRIASAFGSSFSDMPDKQQAWNDLIKLTNSEDRYVRAEAVFALDSALSCVPDKQYVWNDLHKLTNDEDGWIRHRVAFTLGSSFSSMPDKQQAWNDLILLTKEENRSVGAMAASTLGSVFSQMPNEKKAWNDLIVLTNDRENNVKDHINHSLGKISIFKASKAEKEEDYKKELEKAIEFFEKSAQESPKWDNPSRFCLPFYRSFHTIIFKKQEARQEVDKYLAEAKNAMWGSESKKLFFEAVNNLANALNEVQNLENLDLEAKKSELNFYRQYCDRAAELMRETEKKAPFATIAMRKGLPILDRNLKELLEEIQKRAKIACKEAKGTDAEDIACAINREIQRWEIGSQEEIAFNLENLIFTLESSVPRIPENQYIFNRIQQIREQKDVPRQYGIISTIIPLFQKYAWDKQSVSLKTI